MSHPAPEALLTTKAVGEWLQVSPATVTEWARSGRIPAVRTPGGQWRFRRADLEQLADNPKEGAGA